MDELWGWLEARGAHHDVVTWARPYEARWSEAWRACPRGDWLLGIAARAGVDRRAIVDAACACARFALAYLPDGEDLPGRAIEAGERWARGSDETDGVEERAALLTDVEAFIERAPDPIVAAAATAALAALRSIDAPEEAPLVVVSAVQAALLDVGDCAMMSAVAYAQSTCADRVRGLITAAQLQDAISINR